MKAIITLALAGTLLGGVLFTAEPVSSVCGRDATKKSIATRLEGKSKEEAYNIKACEIVETNKDKPRSLVKGALTIEIVSINQIDQGVEVYARAWKNGTPVGFGADGSVETERFRFFNPPVLVPDGTTRIEMIDGVSVRLDNMKEDPEQALKTVLFNVVNQVGKETRPVAGKVGNTTSTFYPSFDGVVGHDDVSSVWATVHDAATGTDVNTIDAVSSVMVGKGGGGNFRLYRAATYFDTSAISDTDSIDSGTLSLYFTNVIDDYNTANSFGAIVDATPASDTALTTADYDQFGTTLFSGTADLTSISTVAYTVFTLNSSGLSDVSKTGKTTMGFRIGEDINNADPGGIAGQYSFVSLRLSETGGTTQDPYLTVVHTAAAAPASVISDTIFFE